MKLKPERCGECRTSLAKKPSVKHMYSGQRICLRCAEKLLRKLWDQVQDEAQKARNAHGELFSLYLALQKRLNAPTWFDGIKLGRETGKSAGLPIL